MARPCNAHVGARRDRGGADPRAARKPRRRPDAHRGDRVPCERPRHPRAGNGELGLGRRWPGEGGPGPDATRRPHARSRYGRAPRNRTRQDRGDHANARGSRGSRRGGAGRRHRRRRPARHRPGRRLGKGRCCSSRARLPRGAPADDGHRARRCRRHALGGGGDALDRPGTCRSPARTGFLGARGHALGTGARPEFRSPSPGAARAS